MEENNEATARNGHEQKDMYNPETNTLDIHFDGLYPSNVLSNLYQGHRDRRPVRVPRSAHLYIKGWLPSI